jgi:small-conductance mechanosensitive channel
MVSSELRKKLVFFAGLIAIVAVILLLVPVVEEGLQKYVYSYFNLETNADGQLMAKGGELSPGKTALTILSVIINLFHILKIILWMTIVISIVRFVTYLIFGAALRKSAEYEISSILKTVLSVIIYIVAFFIIFQSQYPSIDLTALFTGSTIVGIVVGLALQDTLGNLFAGIAIQADQPFQVGDVINIGANRTGIVEQVSWRGVKIRTFQNKLLVISNSVLGKEYIEVAPRDNLNARLVFFNTLYKNSPAKTISLIRDVVQKVENVSPKIRPIVRIRNLGDNGVDFEVKYWLEDYSKFNDTDALIRQRIWYAFQRENIHFAYPTRTLFMEKAEAEQTIASFDHGIAERIRHTPIFAPLSDEEIQQIVKAVDSKIYSPEEPIVKRGQKGSSMFIIHRGAVKIQIREGGKPKIIRTLQEGDFFGEMALFTGEPRTATVIATEETEVLQIKHTGLKPILKNNPTLVESFGEIIEKRREKLSEVSDVHKTEDTGGKAGVFNSIRKFFGLRN